MRYSASVSVIAGGPMWVAVVGCSSSVRGSGARPSGAAFSDALPTTPLTAGSNSVIPSPSIALTAPKSTSASAPRTVVVTTTAAPLPSPAGLPVFAQLKLSTGTPSCASQAVVTTVPEILTWQVANATGIAVGIDDTTFGDPTKYNGASGSQTLTNIGCSGSAKYTFDVWTTGSPSCKQAHQQLSVTGPA
jgi:hypothetical protein